MLEAFELDDHDLGRCVYFKFLTDVAVLLADVAVPLVVATERLFLRVALEAVVQVDALVATRSQFIVLLCISGLEVAVAEGVVAILLEDDCED